MNMLEVLSADFDISKSSGQIIIKKGCIVTGKVEARNLTTKEIFSALLTLQDLANDDVREFRQVLSEADAEVERLKRRVKELESAGHE